MIYTLGNKKMYDEMLDEMDYSKSYATKIGKRKDYEGGSVWKTYEESLQYKEKHKLDEFDVYGVLANWETDTEEVENEIFRNLINDSRLVKLTKNGDE